MIKLTEIKVPIEFSKKAIYKSVAEFLGVDQSKIGNIIILKKALDARNKKQIVYKCNLAVEIDEALLKKQYENYEEPKRVEIKRADKLSAIVVGSGPSGLFAALTLARSGAKVMVIEKGESMEKRIKSVETFLKTGKLSEKGNIQVGEGGAGTFSDGKLNTGISSLLVREVLLTFNEFGAENNILYDSRPHIGTDQIRKIVVNMRKKIEKLGGKFLFETKFVGFKKKSTIEVEIEKNGTLSTLNCDKLILGLGYSARDTHRMLLKSGISYKPKAFSVGYRIEHLQEDINVAQYGSNNPFLPPAEYKLFAHLPSGRTVYTFCMCPGGEVVPAVSEQGEICTNGMSYNARKAKNANSAILVSVDEKDFPSKGPLSGIDFQEKLEKEAFIKGNGNFIVSRLEDFMASRASDSLGKVNPSIRPKYQIKDVSVLLPSKLNKDIREGIKIFGKKLSGFDDPDAILTGIETRSSAPFMVERKENLQSSIENVYCVGEGAGMAGGIVSSAVDGMKIALKIIDEVADEGK